MEIEFRTQLAINGCPIRECYDVMPKEEFIQYIETWADNIKTRLSAWEFICSGFKKENK